jgi:hypothetical protein
MLLNLVKHAIIHSDTGIKGKSFGEASPNEILKKVGFVLQEFIP